MTDEQIIKALECCVNDDEGVLGFCNNGCPLFGKNANCPEVLRKNALDLINRQKAEIERLEAQHREMCIGMKVLKVDHTRVIRLWIMRL